MILTCPNCGTQYVVKDGAIPPQGRQVRCASCKHSWHQDPELAGEPAGEDAAAVEDQDETIAEATLIEPRTGPEAEERAFEESVVGTVEAEPAPPPEDDVHDRQERTVAEYAAEQRAAAVSADFEAAADDPGRPVVAAADWKEPPLGVATDDEFSPFPAADETAPRARNPIVTIAIVVIVVAVLAAAFYFLAPPELKARVGLGTGAASQLALIVTHRDRQQLESGNQLLTVTGRVINPTSKEQNVPPLQAQLRGPGGKVVYSWTIAPPAPTLAAGASASFNSAEVNVPPGGEELTITLGPPRA
jgi:predicted Zn finger-like uncharacterized protein